MAEAVEVAEEEAALTTSTAVTPLTILTIVRVIVEGDEEALTPADPPSTSAVVLPRRTRRATIINRRIVNMRSPSVVDLEEEAAVESPVTGNAKCANAPLQIFSPTTTSKSR